MFKSGLGDLLQQAGKMREEAQRLQETMATKTVEGVVENGKVRVVANGKQQILSVHIAPELSTDVKKLESLVASAVNQALKASQDLMAEEMKKMMGGLGPLASLLGKS